MGKEIERKFLVKGEQWRSLGTGKQYRQGYLSVAAHCTVRVRIAGDRAYLTVKGKIEGLSRPEFEYPIPVPEAEEMLSDLCDRPPIEKIRYTLSIDNLIWEVDEFGGENQGLIVAEVELEDEGQAIVLPEWIGQEVSGDPRYLNSNLVQFPYQQWYQSPAMP
ncbi:MAG: CYTH domain-containing protein [Cyanobacteria bacterium SBLK]|nr:CYTH domain-containing protein [Cyanobacteria bacterium SBLK]